MNAYAVLERRNMSYLEIRQRDFLKVQKTQNEQVCTGREMN